MTKYAVKTSAKAIFNMNEKKAIRVLHVDDEPDFLKLVKQFLEIEGPFRVDTAASAEEATEKMKKESYDAIVSDYYMPGKDGLEFLKELRQEGNAIPFIILTGRGMEEVATQALNLGADYYVNKQVSPEMLFGELVHDIHEAVKNRRAYLAAWVREERLRGVFDSSLDAIMIFDLHGIVVECNQETLRLMKVLSKEEVVGKNALEFVEERDRKLVSDNLNRTLRQGAVKNIEFVFLTKGGRKHVGELSASAAKDSSGNPTSIVAVISDITERKRAENTLRQYSKRLEENHRFLEYVFAAFPDAITICDLKGNIIKCNPATLNLHCYSSENELIGVNLFALFAQGNREKVKEELREAIVSGAIRNIEHGMLRKEGTEFPAELSAGAIMDSFGNPLGFVVITKDVSERKRLQEQLIISEKLAAVGQLAGAFSHDIRNPLAVIENSICFLKMRLKENSDEKVTRHLNILEQEINYANLMVNDLLDFTRKTPPRFKTNNLNKVIKNAISTVSVPDNIKVIFRLDKIPPMLIDETQVQRVFTNLILNAVQAMPDGGELTAETLRHNGFAEVTLSDTGVGIPEENLQKIFAPLFSTKANGIGLGLNICKQIVDGHGGDITVRSRHGAGSTFTVRLPIRPKQLGEESCVVGTLAEKNAESAGNRRARASCVGGSKV